MSLITVIGGIPLYTTKKEALDWAISNKIRGCHTHVFKNKKGYMGGINHMETKSKVRYGKTNIDNNTQIEARQNNVNQPPPSPVQPQPTPPRTEISRTIERIRGNNNRTNEY